MIDGAECIINAAICAMREVFTPSSSQPPLGGGSDKVWFFASDQPAISAVDLHVAECECKAPFLWVRLVKRYPVRDVGRLPSLQLGGNPCGDMKAIQLELGVARCAVTEAEPERKSLETEAEVSLDDSWRIELALCRAVKLIIDRECSDATNTDEILPFGPEGGVIGWTGTLFARIDTD